MTYNKASSSVLSLWETFLKELKKRHGVYNKVQNEGVWFDINKIRIVYLFFNQDISNKQVKLNSNEMNHPGSVH